MKKDWTKQDNFSEFEKTKEKNKERMASGMINTLAGRALLFNHSRTQVGAVTEKFKRSATPEELEALKKVRHDKQDREYL